jgi:hypothetical protein
MLAFLAIGIAVAWYLGWFELFGRQFPDFVPWLADTTWRFLQWIGALLLWPWERLADAIGGPMGTFMKGEWGRWFPAAFAIWFLGVWLNSRGSRPGGPVPKASSGRSGPPLRIPHFDRPKRPLFVGHDQHNRSVVADLQNAHAFLTAGTRAGKSATMRYLVDAPAGDAVLALLFDVSLPVVSRFRYWQQKALHGEFVVDGKVPPIVVARPNPPAGDPLAVKLRVLDGPAQEVMSRLMLSFKESASSVGDQRGRARDRGVLHLEEADRQGVPRSLDLLIQKWSEDAYNPKVDRETRTSCWRWQSKVRGLKAMLGEMEGPDGLAPLDILNAGGKLAIEINNFAVAEAAGAVAPLFLGLAIWLVNTCKLPVTVLMDEGNQLGQRVEDVDKLYTASGARDGRCCMCAQKPLVFHKTIATNVDVWVIGGFGPGAVAEREWAEKVTGGVVPAEGFMKLSRTFAARFMRSIGKLKPLMNLECYVIHEGTTEGPVRMPNPLPEMRRYLHHYDWPRNRATIPVPLGILEPDPNEPTDPPDQPPEQDKTVFDPNLPATSKKPSRPLRSVADPPKTKTGTVVVKGGSSGTVSRLAQGEPPGWVRSNADGMRWWPDISGTGNPDPNAMWLWTGPRHSTNGRPKSSRVVSPAELARLRLRNPNARASQSCLVYPEVYVMAGCPNGQPWEGCSYDHLSHSRDETCAGGSECVHVLDVNPNNIEPVSAEEQARRRDAQRAMHNEWRKRNGLEPLERSVDRAADASVESRKRLEVVG